MSSAIACLQAGWLGAVHAACPVEGPAAPEGTWLVVRGSVSRDLTRADVEAMPGVERVQRDSVAPSGATSPAAAITHSRRYEGVLLRDIVAAALGSPVPRHALRAAVVEAVAIDGYRASFSWGELDNSAAGDHVLVIRSFEGRALTATEGPLGLRASADLRPGPHHVRQLCGGVVRLPRES